jgi:hypothetical protein
MSDKLGTYLQDHLAGAKHAVELLEWMKKEHQDDGLGRFVGELLLKVENDREVLQKVAERTGAGPSNVKEMGSWLGEKVGRLKLRDHGEMNLGTFEALEFMVLGIHGKLVMWRALAELAVNDRRLKGFDLGQLVLSAEEQENAVDEWRLRIARTALAPSADSESA